MPPNPPRRARRSTLAGVAVTACALAVPQLASAAHTERIAVGLPWLDARPALSSFPSLSWDGHDVAFASSLANLVPGDTNGEHDVFVRDRRRGVTERVSVRSDGRQVAAGAAAIPEISGDGRYVVFISYADDLVPGDTNGVRDAFMHDRATGRTTRVSVGSGGTQANGEAGAVHVNADGRFVTFTSGASNLVPGDTNGRSDVFLHDTLTGRTERVSLGADGAQPQYWSGGGAMSADGRFVVFTTFSANIVPGDVYGGTDVFVRDRRKGTTIPVSVNSAGDLARPYLDHYLSVLSEAVNISADGRRVAFASTGVNLVPEDDDPGFDVFLRDLVKGTTTLVSTGTARNVTRQEGISPDGRYVLLRSIEPLLPEDTNNYYDLYLRDLKTGRMELVSVDSKGSPRGGGARYPSPPSRFGRHVAFQSYETLAPGPQSGANEIYLRDRVSSCQPRPAIQVTKPVKTLLRLCHPWKGVVAKIRVSKWRIAGDLNPRGGRIPLVVRVNGKKARIVPTRSGYWFSARRPAGKAAWVSISRV